MYNRVRSNSSRYRFFLILSQHQKKGLIFHFSLWVQSNRTQIKIHANIHQVKYAAVGTDCDCRHSVASFVCNTKYHMQIRIIKKGCHENLKTGKQPKWSPSHHIIYSLCTRHTKWYTKLSFSIGVTKWAAVINVSFESLLDYTPHNSSWTTKGNNDMHK